MMLGEIETAKAEYEEALQVCQRMRFRPEIALIRLDMAEMLLDEGEQSEAQAHLDFAITEFREMKMQPALERALKRKGLLTA